MAIDGGNEYDSVSFFPVLQMEEGGISRRLEEAFPNPGLVRIILLERRILCGGLLQYNRCCRWDRLVAMRRVDYARKRMPNFPPHSATFEKWPRLIARKLKSPHQLPPVNPAFINSVLIELSLSKRDEFCACWIGEGQWGWEYSISIAEIDPHQPKLLYRTNKIFFQLLSIRLNIILPSIYQMETGKIIVILLV